MAKNSTFLLNSMDSGEEALETPPSGPSSSAPQPRGPFATNLASIHNPRGTGEKGHEKMRPDLVRMVWVTPDRCRPWRHHNRIYPLLNEITCADLIEGFRAVGRQEHPALVRKLPEAERPDGKGGVHDFEIITGVRRHWTVAYFHRQGELNHEGVPYEFLIQARDDLSDEEAFLLSDVDNRARQDISDYERGQEYRWALAEFYDNVIQKMADAVQLDRSHVSRLIQLTEMPTDVVAAYPSVLEIKEYHWRVLSRYFQAEHTSHQEAARRILACARTIHAQRQDGSGQAPADGSATFRLLKAAAVGRHHPAGDARQVFHAAASGRVALRVRRTAHNLTLVMPLASGASPDEIKRLLMDVVDAELGPAAP